MTPQLTTTDVATLLELRPQTIRAYRSRGLFPEPDGHLGRTPWWTRETVTAWQAGRPGGRSGRPRRLG